MDRARLPKGRPPESSPPRHLIACGETLRELQVWTEARWESTPESLRPSPATHFPGLGWVVAVPMGRED